MPFREKTYKDRPFKGIGIDLIDSCNVGCSHCYNEKKRKYSVMLTFEQMKYIIDKAAPFFGEIYLLGGEPTLHPQIIEITRYAVQKYYNVILVTNGVKLADTKFCKKLAHPKLSLSMHLRAVNPRHSKLVDRLANKKGTFWAQKKAWQNVMKYWPQKADKNVQVNILRPLIDAGCILEVFSFARKNGLTPIVEMTKSSDYYKRGNHLDPDIYDVQKLYQELREYDRTFYGHNKKQLAHILSPPSYNHTCTLAETGIHVTVSGSVLPCVGHKGVDLGNILTADMEELCLHPVLKAIRNYQQWIVGPCSKCEFLVTCRGGCRGEAFFATGCARASDPYCFNIPAHFTLQDMVPITCEGCVLQGSGQCRLKI